jgi:hypothetical protein
MRRFIITMYQKGKLQNRHSGYDKFITYEKTTNKATQIAVIDFEGIEEELKREREEYTLNGGQAYLSDPADGIKSILGIANNSPYKLRNELREIKENDKEGYCSLDLKYITKESEKAYQCKELEMWIPKSQTIKEGNTLYIKRWVIENN